MRGKCRASSVSMAVPGCVCRGRKLELPIRYYLYVFCNCGEHHVPTFKAQTMRGKNSPRGDECWSFVLRLRASAAELDIAARSVGILKQSLKLPFHAARNAEGCGCLTAGYLR